MMKQLIALSALSLSVLAASPVFAEDKPGAGPNPFSECGIGAALFPKTHWAAVTSNVIWDLGTTAVTSATMSPETCSGKNVAAAQFIGETYASLVEETARGEGEHLTTVLDILECSPARHADAILRTRGYMQQHVTADGYESRDSLDKAADYYRSVTAAVSESCSA